MANGRQAQVCLPFNTSAVRVIRARNVKRRGHGHSLVKSIGRSPGSGDVLRSIMQLSEHPLGNWPLGSLGTVKPLSPPARGPDELKTPGPASESSSPWQCLVERDWSRTTSRGWHLSARL